MATQPHSNPLPEPPNGDDRRIVRLAREIRSRVQANPIIIGGLVITIVGLGIGLSYVAPPARLPVAEYTLDQALAELDAGRIEAARYIAVELRHRVRLPDEEQGGPPFVLGVALASDAEDHWSVHERKALFLVAARYLQESLRFGAPAGREAQCRLLLGKCLFESGRFADSIGPLSAAAEAAPENNAEAWRLLAEAYVRIDEPRWADALRCNGHHLAISGLTAEQEQEAILARGRILLEMGDLAKSQDQLAKIRPDSSVYPESLILEARMIMRAAEQLEGQQPTGGQSGDQRELATNEYARARDKLRQAQAVALPDSEAVRQAGYLLGICYRRMGDPKAADAQFARTRRSYFDTAEGLAAGLEEGDIQRILGRHENAIESYRRVARLAADTPAYSNPWVSLENLQSRLESAYREYVDSKDFQHAIALADALSPIISRPYSIQLQAEAEVALAEGLAKSANTQNGSEATDSLVEAREGWRRAGRLYEQLARIQFTTRRYPEDLWKSANAYFQGQDYERTVRLLRSYLENQTRRELPPALKLLGEALLALNRPDESLGFLNECIASFPKDPQVYQARMIAAQAYLEIGNSSRAKQLLVENLNNEQLTPRSIEWRESLFAWGKIHHREGIEAEGQSRLEGVNSRDPEAQKKGLKQLERASDSFRKAIVALSEAVERDKLEGRNPDDPKTVEARYLLAESHRRAAKFARKRLPTITIETTRVTLSRKLQQELSAAEVEYLALQRTLNDKQDNTALSEVEKRILRNCYFARADVLFDLEQYERAIRAYSTATNRYQHEPESLEAYVQIANCHRQLERPSEARGTLEQAKVVLRQIRPEADFSQTTRYNREEWNDLLDWLSTL